MSNKLRTKRQVFGLAVVIDLAASQASSMSRLPEISKKSSFEDDVWWLLHGGFNFKMENFRANLDPGWAKIS